MESVLDAIRRIVQRWAVTRTDLIANANSGSTSISVKSTRRFRIGDQFLIHNNSEDMENQLYVRSVPDRNTINLGDSEGNPKALKWNWANGGHVVKTQDDMLVKAVFLGEPDIIIDLPAITVSMQNRSSEFFTLRSTKERYNVEITVYVSGSTQEDGDRFLLNLVDTIQYGLKRNFYPLLNNYKTSIVTVDLLTGDRHIRVPDSSIFAIGSRQIIIEDEYNIEVHSVSAICDPTTIQIAQPLLYDYLKEDVIVIKPNRLPFNSWPSEVTFGKIKKGTLLKAAVISYFVEEMEDQLDSSFGDTQLR